MMNLEELSAQALMIVKAEAKHRIDKFGETPVGTVIKAAGQKVIEAKREGRDISAQEVANFFFNIGEVFDGVEKEDDG